MHPLEKKTLKTLKQDELVRATEKIVIAVSAGPDSMALLHVLSHLASVLDITPAAAYVNHGLRPHEAEEEKKLVASEAARLEVPFFSGSHPIFFFLLTMLTRCTADAVERPHSMQFEISFAHCRRV